MAFTVVLLDVLEIGGFLDPHDFPIHVLQPAMQMRVIVSDAAHHELKVLLVDGVEPDKGGVELEINLRDA